MVKYTALLLLAIVTIAIAAPAEKTEETLDLFGLNKMRAAVDKLASDNTQDKLKQKFERVKNAIHIDGIKNFEDLEHVDYKQRLKNVLDILLE